MCTLCNNFYYVEYSLKEVILIDANSGHLDGLVVFVKFNFIQIRPGHTGVRYEHAP